MKTKQFIRLLFGLLSVYILTGCDDDTPYYGNGYPSEYNLLYSNKISTQPGTGTLVLDYSGSPAYGREAWFEMSDATHATIKLFDVFPTEQETLLEAVTLTKTQEGYELNASGVSEKGTTFTLTGGVEEGILTLDLTDVKIPSNALGEKTTFTTKTASTQARTTTTQDTSDPSHWRYETINEYYITSNVLLDWRVKLPGSQQEENLFALEAMDLSELLQSFLSNFVFLLVDQFQFQTDGNITARYAGIPDNFNIAALLLGANASMRGPLVTSPANLCYYLVEDETVYIQLNLDMVLQTVLANRTKSDAGTSADGLDLNALLDLYPQLNRWMNEGIRFRLEKNEREVPREETTTTVSDQGTHLLTTVTINRYYERCDYKLYIEESEVEPLVELLPALLELLLGDLELSFDAGILGTLDLGPMVDELIGRIPYTSACRLGLTF
ncbi:MAG: DUF4925 domain-containing protein [Tannerellaceae bacterium]|nr:DUF4925 domain-containing protein [Tannerellaceae bacterium]